MAQRVASQLNDTGFKLLHFLKSCKSPSQLHQIQAQIILHELQPNSTITSQFITTSQSLNLLNSALLLFHQIHAPHVFICNSLIRAFSHSNSPRISISLYTHMHKSCISPNNYTFPFVLKSISDLKEIKQGQMVHTQTMKQGHMSDIYVLNSLLNVYSSCGNTNICERLFDEMPQRDVVSWTTLIEGNKNLGKVKEALVTFERMQFAGVLPNRVTMVIALSACASSGESNMGVWIHDFIKRHGWELDVILGTSLIDMYGKCGQIEECLSVFRSMNERNVFTWNSLIKGLALAKSGEEAVRWFHMMESDGIKPDEVTLIGVLSACNHSRMVQTGRDFFDSLIDGKYGFPPGIKHYSCMIDMLARAGYLDEAFKLVLVMPFKPTKAIWGALLAGSRAHGNLELCQFAARRLLKLEPSNGAYHVLLSNLYAEMGKWDDVRAIRRLMKERGLVKDLGSSSIGLEGEPYTEDNELLAA